MGFELTLIASLFLVDVSIFGINLVSDESDVLS